MRPHFVLGIWDGHDAGAALLRGREVLFAVNEERLSRRKLDVGFPKHSILACLAFAGISPEHVRDIGVSTSDPAKTLTRIIPRLKEEYYLLRRRKKEPGRLTSFKKWAKYRLTELKPNAVSMGLSRFHLNRNLKAMGFSDYHLSLIDHHEGHAQAAARTSGFDDCAVLTLDGVGDGLSGSLWSYKEGALHPVKKMPARVSLGIFFEHVTNLMNMRELEDEGKVMALANYAYPIEDQQNPLMKLLEINGLNIISDYRSTGLYRELKKTLWRYPSEQFAYMAQRALEKNALSLVREACRITGMNKVALSGGVFSNIKLNMKIAELDEVERAFIFPHMGDGGLAVGSAMAVNESFINNHCYGLSDLYLGPGFSRNEIHEALEGRGLSFRPVEDVAGTAARLICEGEIVLWFQGRMEYAPRALGNRSILARPDDRQIKDQLNILQKKRVWYQPFCPSILYEDLPLLVHTDGREDVDDNRFMTTAFRVKEKNLKLMEGVINIDGTCRPHIVRDENPRFRDLLLEVKARLGKGILLNTSFNIHGEPLVCSPDDALDMFERTGINYLFIEDIIVEK